MKAFKEIYLNTLDAIGEMPSMKKDWRWVLIYSIGIYAVVLAFRLSFAGRWDHPELWVAGERILATHDAYFWLAKAKGVGQLEGYTFAELIYYLNKIFGMPLGDIGFWLPAVLASIVGIVCYLWGWLLGGRNAGIFAGVAGALTPGFFYRSRLGYLDTDPFTLLGPFLVAWMLAYYVGLWTKDGWFVSRRGKAPENSFSMFYAYSLAIAFGLGTRFLCMWHHDILSVSILYFFLAAMFLLVNGSGKGRIYGFNGLVCYLFAAFPAASFSILGENQFAFPFKYGVEVLYIVLAVVLGGGWVLSKRFYPKLVDNKWACLVIVCWAIWVSDIYTVPLESVIGKLGQYMQSGTGEVVASSSAAIFPSTVQSIIEAKLVPLGIVIERGAFFELVGWLALFSAVGIVAIRPQSIFLLPLVALHLLSVKIGIRFSMFGGAALMVFLGVGLWLVVQFALRSSAKKNAVAISVQLFFGVLVLGYSHWKYSELPLTPVIAKPHAEALMEFGGSVPKGSTLWTWWDWGYASQYYGGVRTTIDGGLHSGRDVYATAVVMSTDSMQQASGVVRTVAQHEYIDRGYIASNEWAEMPAGKVKAQINALKDTEVVLPSASPQYVLVCWKDLSLSKWITYFGNWDLETGSTREATVNSFKPGELGIQMERGAVMTRKGSGGLVSDITVLTKDGIDYKEYYLNRLSPQLLPKRRHLLINKVSGQSILIDRIGYRSTMRQLLTGDPNDPEIRKYFKLVVEKLPFVRIYEVVQ